MWRRGCEIGETDIWIGDDTVNPENGGLGGFSHELGHDLGSRLPDLYDRSGRQNSVAFWSLFCNIPESLILVWLNTDSIGRNPGRMSSWEKLQLGWLGYKVAALGQEKTVMLGPVTLEFQVSEGRDPASG
jgi:immune inhibitor A